MAYEYDEFVDAMRFGLTMSDRETTDPVWNMVDEVVNKAKAFDEVKEFIIEKLKEEEEEKPRTLLSDYDYGLYQAYDNVDDIIQEHLEGADDER